MTELYRLRSVTKRYGANVAVDIDALTIAAGRMYTLTGANGAGKSTLLGILAFLTPPTSGEIFYAGERIDWKSDIVRGRRRKVTLLHQSPYLFGGTVSRNVAYGLNARGIAGGCCTPGGRPGAGNGGPGRFPRPGRPGAFRRGGAEGGDGPRAGAGPRGSPPRRAAGEHRPGNRESAGGRHRLAPVAGHHGRDDHARPGSIRPGSTAGRSCWKGGRSRPRDPLPA